MPFVARRTFSRNAQIDVPGRFQTLMAWKQFKAMKIVP
jgi:hypothetical protein